jgi:hypothetical protein
MRVKSTSMYSVSRRVADCARSLGLGWTQPLVDLYAGVAGVPWDDGGYMYLLARRDG